MKCPHCGNPMPEEALFCEHCGKERQLVPDYEAEINESIDETISNIAVDLANTQEIVPQDLVRHKMIKEQLNIEEKPQPEAREDQPPDSQEKSGKEPAPEPEVKRGEETEEPEAVGADEADIRRGSVRIPLLLLGAVAILAVLIAAGATFLMRRDEAGTYESQLEQAAEYENQGNYEQMLAAARKASELADNSSAAKILVAKAYAGLGRVEEQKIVLEGLVITDPAFTDAYTMLIPLYEDSGQYQKIAEVLENCPDATIIDRYSEYIANPPEFSVEGGTYIEAVSVKLLASGSGTIYYTVDGSAPTVESSVYSMPILIDDGKVKIRTIYQNSYGIISEESSAQYSIEVRENDVLMPEVNLASGSYDQPQIIKVTSPSEEYQIYYTTDGSDPGLESRSYIKPIPLPLGNSQYKFALVDEDGNVGEAVSVSYQLSMALGISEEQAGNLLMQALVSSGAVVDNQGSIAGGGGRRSYEVTSVLMQDEGYFYLLEESFEADDGSVQKTGNLYAVNSTTGQSYSVTENVSGEFTLGAL